MHGTEASGRGDREESVDTSASVELFRSLFHLSTPFNVVCQPLHAGAGRSRDVHAVLVGAVGRKLTGMRNQRLHSGRALFVDFLCKAAAVES